MWSEILRAQEQHRRQVQRAQREWVAANRRAEQAMVRAQKQAQRTAAANAREAERLLHEAGVVEASRLTNEVEERVRQLQRLLTRSLESPPLRFDA